MHPDSTIISCSKLTKEVGLDNYHTVNVITLVFEALGRTANHIVACKTAAIKVWGKLRLSGAMS